MKNLMISWSNLIEFFNINFISKISLETFHDFESNDLKIGKIFSI